MQNKEKEESPYDWVWKAIDMNLLPGEDLDNEEVAKAFSEALRSVAVEIEKPFEKKTSERFRKEYNPNDPANW